MTSAGRFFKLSAMRTRKLASDRQKEKNFMGRHSTVMPGLDPGIHRSSKDSCEEMDHRVKPGDDEAAAVAPMFLALPLQGLEGEGKKSTPVPPSCGTPDAPRSCSRADAPAFPATTRRWRGLRMSAPVSASLPSPRGPAPDDPAPE